MKNSWLIYMSISLLLTYIGVSSSITIISVAGLISAIASLILAVKKNRS